MGEGEGSRVSEADRDHADAYVASLIDSQRPGFSQAQPIRFPRLRRVVRRARLELIRLGLARESIQRRWRSPRYVLGRWRARIKLVAFRKAVTDPRLLSSLLLIGLGLVWTLTGVEKHVTPAKPIVNSLFAGAGVGLLVLLWTDYVRSPQQARRLRRRIRRQPDLVLPYTPSPSQAEVIPREDLLDAIPRDDLYDEAVIGMLPDDRRDVQVIVGEPGSGKTTALVGVAGRLARIGMYPVFVPLRATDTADAGLDIVKLARDRFERQVRIHMRSEAELDTLWQWLYCRKRLAVLTDDVDQLTPDGEKGFALRRTLEALATRDIPVVVTARPAGIPAGVAASAIGLGELDEDEVVKQLIKAARNDPGAKPGQQADDDELRQWVQDGRLTEVPFYLELLAALDAVDRRPKLRVDLEHHPGRSRNGVANPNWVRFDLLESYYEALRDGSAHRWLGIGETERRSTLDALEDAALGMLKAISLEASLRADPHDSQPIETRVRRRRIEDFLGFDDRSDLEEARTRRRVSAHEVVDTGERLRLLDRNADGTLQFRHRIMQAYLAARALSKKPISPQLPLGGAVDGHRRSRAHLELDSWLESLLDDHHPEKLSAHMTVLFTALRRYEAIGEGALTRRAGDEALELILDELVRQAVLRLHAEAPTPGAADLAPDPSDPSALDDPETRRDPDDALLKLTTAADIAHATEHGYDVDDSLRHGHQARIVAAVEEAHAATRWTKLDAIRAVATLDVARRWGCIWQFTRDNDYAVRRAASAELQEDADAAYLALEGEINELLERAALRCQRGESLVAADNPAVDGGWEDGDVLSLKALGWVLPAIVSGFREEPENGGDSSDDERKARVARVGRAQRHLDTLVALAMTKGQHDLEASLAQGFKGDAMRHAEDPDGRHAGPGWVAANQRAVQEICLEHAEFWYARMVLHQALGLYAIARGGSPVKTLDTYARFLRVGVERHPFARRAARLARRGVERRQLGSERWKGLIWNDEGEVVSRRSSWLTYRAAQLVGDVTLLLNLNERNEEDMQAKFGYEHSLPVCLSSSPHRREILGSGCPPACGWGMCPYKQPPPDEPNAHRGVSRAFCRQQKEIANHRSPQWQRPISRRALAGFWREMERRARN